MVNVETMIGLLLGREGGYANHPADRGGPTRWGVTEAVAREAGYDGDMRAFPRERAIAIYRSRYWEAPRFDAVAARSPLLAERLFDIGVNMGPAVAIRFLVRLLNALNRGQRDYRDVRPGVVIGPPLLAALTAFLARRGDAGERVLLAGIRGLQVERYVTLAERRPANEAFLFGWLANRIG